MPPARLTEEDGNDAPAGNAAIDDGIFIYPNPASNLVNVEFKNSLAPGTTVMLADMNGRKVMELTSNAEGNNLLQIETGALANGLYYLVVWEANKVMTKKISIVH